MTCHEKIYRSPCHILNGSKYWKMSKNIQSFRINEILMSFFDTSRPLWIEYDNIRVIFYIGISILSINISKSYLHCTLIFSQNKNPITNISYSRKWINFLFGMLFCFCNFQTFLKHALSESVINQKDCFVPFACNLNFFV